MTQVSRFKIGDRVIATAIIKRTLRDDRHVTLYPGDKGKVSMPFADGAQIEWCIRGKSVWFTVSNEELRLVDVRVNSAPDTRELRGGVARQDVRAKIKPLPGKGGGAK